MGLNRIHRGKAIWFDVDVGALECGVLDTLREIIEERPDLEGYFLRKDSEEEAERLEREEEV